MAKKKSDRYLNNNENLPISVEIKYTTEDLEEMRKCKEDIIYFAENYFYIVNLDEGRQKIKLYEPQKAAILKIVNNRRTVICASRQVGKSTLMTVVCLWYALFTSDFNIAILANKEDQAKEILERIKLAYEEIPNFIKAGVWDFTKEQVKLTNGSKIFVSTTSADAIRGKSVNLLFIDEFAHVRKEIADDFFKSIIPTLSSSKKSKLVIVSTPKGVENKFYEIFSNAEKKKSNWEYIKIFWHQIPGRDEAWKKEQLEAIAYDMSMWNQEFDLHFLEDGTSALNGAILEALKNMCRVPDFTYDFGDYQIWTEPKPDRIYSIGVDAAEGVGQDYSVAQILDITDPKDIRHCATFATNRLQPYVFAEKLNQIARAWGRPFLCIESNKEGSQVIDALWEVHKYDNIITYTMKNDKRSAYQKMGIFCHSNSKYTGITNMKYFVEHLQAVKIYDINTVKEFETFVRKENKTWAAKKGYHDDRIMSFIWALVLLEKEIAEKYLDILEYDETGKPCRIADPNQELANMSFYNQDNVATNYTKSGGAPLPMFFQKGNAMFNYKEYDMKNYADNGWAFVR